MRDLGLRPAHANLLAICLMGLIFYLSHQPGSGPDAVLPWIPGEVKELLHIPMFGLLALLYWLGTNHYFKRPSRALLFALTLTLAYGLLDEWHQSFIPDRTPALNDIAKDFFGGLITLLGAVYWQARERKKRTERTA